MAARARGPARAHSPDCYARLVACRQLAWPVRELPESARFERSSSCRSACLTFSGTCAAVPRHTHTTMSQRRSTSASERGRPSRRQRPPTREVDAQALALRESGSSYSAIARRLELGRAVDAHRSFVRALGAHQGAERQRLVDNEEARLDLLERRIRERDAAEPEKVTRRLAGVDKFREAIRR